MYSVGTCESLECAIDSRNEKKDPLLLSNKPIVYQEMTKVSDPTVNHSIFFFYFAESVKTNDVRLIFFELTYETVRIDSSVIKLKLMREDRAGDTKFVGSTVVDSLVCPRLVMLCK